MNGRRPPAKQVIAFRFRPSTIERINQAASITGSTRQAWMDRAVNRALASTRTDRIAATKAARAAEAEPARLNGTPGPDVGAADVLAAAAARLDDE